MKQKIRYLHLSDNFYPLMTGGTEIFIQQLINVQISLPEKYEVIWACHKSNNRYKFKSNNLENYKIFLDPVLQDNRLNTFSFIVKEVPGFYELLKRFKPDVVHIHSFGSKTTINHVEVIKAFGAKLIFSLHTPPCSCMGNLLNASHDICTGDLIDRRCTFLRLKSKGIPYLLAKLISYQNGWPFSPNYKNIISRLLTSRKLTSNMHISWINLMNQADNIHVLSDWCKNMLIKQKISSNKINLIRTAGPQKLSNKKRLPMEDDVLKLVFWGRCNPEKGLEIVIEAILMLNKDLPVKLDIYGPYWGEDNYSINLIKKIKNDLRINYLGNIPQQELLNKLQYYDLGVVPSIWMETGPLTILEAFAAGLPIAGTNLGGIKELLDNQLGCFLLPSDPIDWKNLFSNLLNNKVILSEFRPPKIRTFYDIESDFERLILKKYIKKDSLDI
ncbi:Hypothetical protein P9515_13821 [Prochlorococcus marinus str. MIT 9515]|uniref:Glycosyl transferase family 1 domain-containing protein n=1 Tax=Prochlorococcus marinus (strain MIT 9515) TaxID=167542 RepID=A2BXS8_PROM5|nr:glycosyltransferase [Prochlorococcus marinus]ABM72589.1 Hypothetical protein P9515_13821 [Prochlorococcus marinus str. MIT 9515]